MTTPIKINDDPSGYGSKGETWAPEFVAYMKAIVTHPIYENMPDAINDDGKIQWEAPSNRSGGKYQFTHNKRQDWWKSKARSLGIDISKDQWISCTAKRIHPTGEKPCKRCGLVSQIAYVYPGENLIKRFNNYIGEDIGISTSDPIKDALQNAYDVVGENLFEHIIKILGTKAIGVPDFNKDFEALLSWIDNQYVPNEPSMLSPGAMSNAPDRFDGFHSFNRCCRGKADTGRHPKNLMSYTTDRRVFEYWSEGDWIAADRLMGLVKSTLRNEPSADGGDGPPTPDHIGPLSLGFCHRPEFKLLSKAANSAKNNRMTLCDVKHLIASEISGEHVASWYTKPLWNSRKTHVDNDEKALRLSKILRDNQRNSMQLLCSFLGMGKYAFLVYLLELGYADRKVEFRNLKVIDFITHYDCIDEGSRTTKYATEQKVRRIRIGFEALRTYEKKENRHTFLVAEEEVSKKIKEAVGCLNELPEEYKGLDDQLHSILFPYDGIILEEELREFSKNFPIVPIPAFEKAKQQLIGAMEAVASVLGAMWEDDRYIREEYEID